MKLIQRFPCYSDPRMCKFVHIDNKLYIISNHNNGYIKFTDVDTQYSEKFKTFSNDIRTFDIYQTYMISQGDHNIRLFDLGSRKLIWEKQFKFAPKQVAFSKNGKYFAMVGHRACIIYDTNTQQEKYRFSIKKNTVCSLAFHPLRDEIAIAMGNNIAVYNFVSAKKILDIRGHKTLVKSIAFNSSGDRLVSSSEDYTVRIWSLKTGEQLLVLAKHTSAVNSVQFFGNDQYILSGSYDKNLIIWGYRNSLREK